MEESAIQAHIARSLRICRDGFPDLYFGMLDGRDSISLGEPGGTVGFIRLRATARTVLHLKYIEVFAMVDGEERNLAPRAFLSVSSIWPGSEVMLREQWFLNRHENNYGFHTDNEDEPWAIVVLNTRAPITRIVIHNRTDEFGPRAWLVAVDVSEDGQLWREIYSHPRREATFRECLTEAALHNTDDGPSYRERRLLDALLTHVLRLEYLPAEKLLWDEVKDAALRRSVIAAINAQVNLPAAGIEWTNHGVKRTFRFWSQSEKTKYLADTLAVLRDILSRNPEMEACIGYGAVLALVRDHRLMDHDDDIDIIVSASRSEFANVDAVIAKVGEGLAASGYRLEGTYATHRHVSKDGMFPADVFFGFREGDFVSWLPGPRKVIRREEVFPPIECTLLGIDIPIPRNPFRYLEKVYGLDWANPQPFWSHKWDDSTFRDWLG